MREEQVAAQAIVDCSRRLHARGLIGGAEGNCSVRLPDGSMLITASGIDKATLTTFDVLRRHADGTEYHRTPQVGDLDDIASRDSGRSPSSEMQMHVGLYAARPDVCAIVHAHPPVATGFATAGRALQDDVLPELSIVVGPIAAVPYGRPGTAALWNAIEPFARDHEVFLLANHGVTVVGRSLSEAIVRMESVEQAARILLSAELLGGARVLSKDEVEVWRAMRRATAGSKVLS